MTRLAMRQNDLSAEEVTELVYSYESIDVTDELIAFGQIMLSEVQQRAGQIDSKAATILGWSTAVLAFLFASFYSISITAGLAFSAASAVAAAVSALQAYRSLRAREGWQWPSDADWFEKSALVSGDELKRFHLRCWHGVNKSQNVIAERKGKLLLSGQHWLLIAGGILGSGLVIRLLNEFLKSSTLIALNDHVWAWSNSARWML